MISIAAAPRKKNVPGEAVVSARQAGHDVAWIAETTSGVDDELVLATALAERRVLVTFTLAFAMGERHHGTAQSPSCTSSFENLAPLIRGPRITRTTLIGKNENQVESSRLFHPWSNPRS